MLPICVAAMAAGVFLIVHDRNAPMTGNGVAPAGVDGLAKQTAEAKAVLADLQDQTAAADWHLKQLDEQIHTVNVLPDGRTRISNSVTGQPVVLIPKLEALQKLSADRAADALPLAKECVDIYEATRDQMNGAVFVGGETGPETIAWMYVTASTAAQRASDHDHALTWARAAVATRPTAERQFLLVTALINKDLQAEANGIIQQELKAGGAEAAKFRQFLDQYKIPYKRPE